MLFLNSRRVALCGAVLSVLGASQKAGAAQAAYSSLVQARNPLVYLMMDETSGTSALDSGPAASPNPGTYGAGATINVASASAVLNKAVSASGANLVLTVPTATEFDNVGTGDFSVEFWFNTSNITTREDLFQFKNPAVANSDLGIQLGSETADRLSVFHDAFRISSTTAVTANVWHHLALTRVGVGGAMTLYLDGVVAGTGTDTNSVNTSGGPMAIGSKTAGTLRTVTGSMDEFAFYNSVLTPANIAADIVAANVPEPGVLGALAIGAVGALTRRRRQRH